MCPACKTECLNEGETFCPRCCRAFDKLFPDGSWHSMETADLAEHYYVAVDSGAIDLDELDGIQPASPAQKPEEGNFLERNGIILITAGVVVLALLILWGLS